MLVLKVLAVCFYSPPYFNLGTVRSVCCVNSHVCVTGLKFSSSAAWGFVCRLTLDQWGHVKRQNVTLDWDEERCKSLTFIFHFLTASVRGFNSSFAFCISDSEFMISLLHCSCINVRKRKRQWKSAAVCCCCQRGALFTVFTLLTPAAHGGRCLGFHGRSVDSSLSVWQELDRQYSPSRWSHRMSADDVIKAHVKALKEGRCVLMLDAN